MGIKESVGNIRDGIRRRNAVLIVAGIVVVWAHATWFFLTRKVGLLDDGYIYLHLASNVLETGTARMFPLAGSGALLATSPLRLLILVPASFLAHLVTDPRSVEAARLTFLFGGLLTGFLFLPFLRNRLRFWGVGMLASGLLATATESALQMEGLMIFWVILILAGTRGDVWRKRPGRLGVLSALLLLIRPEYGLPVLVFGAGWLLADGRWRPAVSWAKGLVLILIGWLAFALVLQVYPLPTTLISKVITGNLELFGTSFGTQLPQRMQDYFFAGNRLPSLLVWVISAGTVAALAVGSARHRVLSLLLILVCLLLWNAAGNYQWYFENLLIGLIALIIGWLASTGGPLRPHLLKKVAAGWLVAVLVLVTVVNWGRADRLENWSLRGESTRASGYRNIGRAYVGKGLFAFPGTAPSYLVMREIGIVSYFGGKDVWLFDAGGLAQPGTLKGLKKNFLARLYPGSLLVTASEELEAINSRFGRDFTWPPIWMAYSYGDDEEGPEKCTIYLPDQHICLMPARTR